MPSAHDGKEGARPANCPRLCEQRHASKIAILKNMLRPPSLAFRNETSLDIPWQVPYNLLRETRIAIVSMIINPDPITRIPKRGLYVAEESPLVGVWVAIKEFKLRYRMKRDVDVVSGWW